MFVIILKFADKSKAANLMPDHNAWLDRNFKGGIFVASGSLQPATGGCIFARGATRAEIEEIVAADPFVAEGVVKPDIVEVALSRTEPELQAALV